MATSLNQIQRYPVRKNELLQGWDSADELLLDYIQGQVLKDKKILIINDQFGALSCGLKDWDCCTYTDSFVSYKAIEMNSHHAVQPIHRLNDLSGVYDYVLIQLPKNMSFFEDLLCHLTQHLSSQSKIICGAMVKHMAPSAFDLINKHIGVTTTSLAKKKARLIFADFQKTKVESPYPLKIKIENFSVEFTNNSNLFSREKLDIGTRFFLEHIPQGPFHEILDLGCANGIVGIKAQQLNPGAKIIFSDESSMAVESAKTNHQNMCQGPAEFIWNNCYENRPVNSLDLVLCNPPFHQQSTIGDFISWQMFLDSFESLRPGGLIRVIGNSHLAYQVALKKIFGNSKIITTNSKFMICEATKAAHP